ncbi:putative lipid phosphate phosphatase 3, chloroplastic, partial [Daucus carota subsp. sativus]|uniref:putative lipid phosphate phosphatase 3, chloroplastic n=1 Tax=Daucus carota subsp. sativus TaxID=79200 RepID=UPI0030831788
YAGSFAGLGFLSFYLAGKLKAFDQKVNVAKICTVLLPLLAAALVCVSRVDDYRHHWQDVFVGGLLGLVMATICYLQFFPPPYHTNGWGPYAHFDVVGEASSTQFPVTPVDDIEMHVTQSQAARTSELFVTIPLGHNSSSMLNEVEAEKM